MAGESVDEAGKTYTYTKRREEPKFNTGNEKFYQYLKTTVKYPREAALKKITGRVELSFIVKRTGEITDVKVINDIDPSLAREAHRVISAAPNWGPGLIHGKPVDMIFHIPVSFSMR